MTCSLLFSFSTFQILTDYFLGHPPFVKEHISSFLDLETMIVVPECRQRFFPHITVMILAYIFNIGTDDADKISHPKVPYHAVMDSVCALSDEIFPYLFTFRYQGIQEILPPSKNRDAIRSRMHLVHKLQETSPRPLDFYCHEYEHDAYAELLKPVSEYFIATMTQGGIDDEHKEVLKTQAGKKCRAFFRAIQRLGDQTRIVVQLYLYTRSFHMNKDAGANGETMSKRAKMLGDPMTPTCLLNALMLELERTPPNRTRKILDKVLSDSAGDDIVKMSHELTFKDAFTFFPMPKP